MEVACGHRGPRAVRPPVSLVMAGKRCVSGNMRVLKSVRNLTLAHKFR